VPELNEGIKRGDQDLFILSPVYENWFYPSVRMGFNEFAVDQWTSHLEALFTGNQYLAYENIGSYRLFNVDAARLICPMFKSWEYCQVPDTPVDTRILSYGWRVYAFAGR
jgi:hypothetical protein